jgi:hypothetical protein
MWNRANAVRWIAPVAAVEAAATGLLLIVSPSLFSRLVLGADLSEPAQALGRLAGIALLGAALPSWPVAAAASTPPSATRALAIYNVLATTYLAYLGLGGHLVGILLWPAVVLHAILSIALAHAWYLWKQDKGALRR